MKLHIMGSAAADGWPAVWCACNHCRRARMAGGKNIRTRSGALIDNKIKIDLCPDTYTQALRDGIDLSAVTDLCITHAHPDHLTPEELGLYLPPFAHGNDLRLHIWAAEPAIKLIQKVLAGRWEGVADHLHILQPLQPVTLGDGTHVLPLPAKHAPETGPLNFIVRRNGETLFYGLDSGWYPEKAWEAHDGYQFDVVVLDCTHGDRDFNDGHGSLNMAIQIKERMLARGTANANTLFIANHFSHNGGLLHTELEAKLGPAGMSVGFDGMVAETK